MRARRVNFGMAKTATQNTARIINLSEQDKKMRPGEQNLLCNRQTYPPAVAK